MKITISQGINPTMYENRITEEAPAANTTASSVEEAKTNADGMTFAETLYAIDQAIASAKEKGQSGLDVNSDAARALGLMAYSSGYAYASLLGATNSSSATYNEALATLTNRYASYTRDMMGYKGDSAANYGGDLACSEELNAYFDEAARTYNVDVKLLKSVAKAESSFRPDAVSNAGAQGIMQLMPTTAANLGVADSFDPYQNIMGGAKYLGALLDTFHGNASYAVAGYNAGGSRVTEYGGIPPFAETQKYVVKVLGYYEDTSYSADATPASNLSTISAGNAVSNTASSKQENSSTLSAEEIQDMIQKAVAEALESALANAIDSSALQSSIQSTVQSSMQDIVEENLGEWLNGAIEDTVKDILAEQTPAATEIAEEIAPETETSEEIPEEIIEDIPVDAPLETPEEVPEDSLEIAPVEDAETGSSTAENTAE